MVCCVTCSPSGGNTGGDVTAARRRPDADDVVDEAWPRCESTEWLRTLPLMARLNVSNRPVLSVFADCGDGGCAT